MNRLCLALIATTALISLATASRGGDDVDVESPFACTVSAFDNDSCETTKDDDGEACVWCTYQSHGLCISADQSDIIEQAMPDINCGGDEEEDEENEDFEDEEEEEEEENYSEDEEDEEEDEDEDEDEEEDVEEDELNEDSEDEEEDEVNEDSEDEEEDEVNEDSEDEEEDEETGDPFDPSCVVAGMNSDDAETICKSTVDQDGDSCVWCDVQGIYGLCLNHDQADAVSQYVTCGSSVLMDTDVA